MEETAGPGARVARVVMVAAVMTLAAVAVPVEMALAEAQRAWAAH